MPKPKNEENSIFNNIRNQIESTQSKSRTMRNMLKILDNNKMPLNKKIKKIQDICAKKTDPDLFIQSSNINFYRDLSDKIDRALTSANQIISEFNAQIKNFSPHYDKLIKNNDGERIPITPKIAGSILEKINLHFDKDFLKKVQMSAVAQGDTKCLGKLKILEAINQAAIQIQNPKHSSVNKTLTSPTPDSPPPKYSK